MFGKIADFFGKALGTVDNVHTSDAERLALKEPLLRLQTEILSDMVEVEKTILDAQARVIEAEARSDSFLAKNWRPITMLSFLAMIAWGQFGGPPVPEQMWPLLQIGLGGYVIGRSVEKTVEVGARALKDREII
jgi:hypothetical protein